jgi:hypothetical protein
MTEKKETVEEYAARMGYTHEQKKGMTMVVGGPKPKPEEPNESRKPSPGRDSGRVEGQPGGSPER